MLYPAFNTNAVVCYLNSSTNVFGVIEINLRQRIESTYATQDNKSKLMGQEVNVIIDDLLFAADLAPSSVMRLQSYKLSY